jgi:hypothetical protein
VFETLYDQLSTQKRFSSIDQLFSQLQAVLMHVVNMTENGPGFSQFHADLLLFAFTTRHNKVSLLWCFVFGRAICIIVHAKPCRFIYLGNHWLCLVRLWQKGGRNIPFAHRLDFAGPVLFSALVMAYSCGRGAAGHPLDVGERKFIAAARRAFASLPTS